jgi:hypothetical protein
MLGKPMVLGHYLFPSAIWTPVHVLKISVVGFLLKTCVNQQRVSEKQKMSQEKFLRHMSQIIHLCYHIVIQLVVQEKETETTTNNMRRYYNHYYNPYLRIMDC